MKFIDEIIVLLNLMASLHTTFNPPGALPPPRTVDAALPIPSSLSSPVIPLADAGPADVGEARALAFDEKTGGVEAHERLGLLRV